MYDMMNGFQIKCFCVPVFYDKQVVYSGGQLDSYANGSKVPLKTLYKIYPNDFIIVSDDSIHFIENGKVLKSVAKEDYCMVTNEELKDLKCFNSNGDEINVSSIEDFNCYYIEKMDMFFKISGLLKPCHALLSKASNIALSKLPYNENTKEKNHELFEATMKEHDDIRESLTEEINMTKKTFYSKWHKENLYEDFERFGALLYVYEEEINENKKDMIEKQMKVFYDKDKEFLNKYEKWQKGEI